MTEKDERQLNSVSRRDFLKLAGVAGVTVGAAGGLGGLLAACGTKEESSTTTTAGTTTTAAGGGATTTTAAAGGETTTSVSASAEEGREVKIGFVSPLTGNISNFGVPDKYCVSRAEEALKDGLICGDGKKHKVTIVLKDSQSDTNRAARWPVTSSTTTRSTS
jgi:hypothetical protein